MPPASASRACSHPLARQICVLRTEHLGATVGHKRRAWIWRDALWLDAKRNVLKPHSQSWPCAAAILRLDQHAGRCQSTARLARDGSRKQTGSMPLSYILLIYPHPLDAAAFVTYPVDLYRIFRTALRRPADPIRTNPSHQCRAPMDVASPMRSP